jgi:hypothetical protein
MQSDLSNEISTKPRKAFTLKTIICATIVTMGAGFGLGYLVKDRMSGSNASAVTDGTAQSLKNPSYGTCRAQTTIDSVALAGASKNIPGTMKVEDVRNHVDWVFNSGPIRYASNTKTSFSCVDARSDDPILGTTGGDLAEFAIGLSVYFKSAGIAPTLESIRNLFKTFLQTHITVERPFYFHTDDSRLRMVYQNMTKLLGKPVTILPYKTPSNSAEADMWLKELTESYAQGCGHIRLMINAPATYGLENDFIIKSLIRVFYEEWWSRSKEDKKVLNFSTKLGPLIGGAIAIVNNTGPACRDASPMVSPSAVGSTLFVFHPGAVTAFRESVLVPFFLKKSNTLSFDNFFKGVNDLFNTQLTATLTNLAPANAVDLFAVNVKSQ